MEKFKNQFKNKESMNYEILEKAGLNKSETRIYLKLLAIGSCKAGKLAKETKYNRTTIYKALETLIRKGLVSYILKENRKYFESNDPKNIIEVLEKKEKEIRDQKKEIESIIPNLARIYESQKEELETKIFKGIKGLKVVFNDIIKDLTKGDEYLAFGIPKHAEIFWGFFEEFNKTLLKKKIKCKIIFDERAKENIESCKKYGYNVKTLRKEFMSPAEINIYNNKTAIVLWHKTPLAILINSKDITNSFRQYFNLLWKIAR